MKKSDNYKILVTGGAGYIGSVLVRLLLDEGYRVRVLDNLMYGGEPIVELLDHPNFEFIKGDIRDKQEVRVALAGMNAIVHLAAIVGDPACSRQPELARDINLKASMNLYNMAEEQGISRFVFASTCSNYGKMDNPDLYVTESSKLAPVSIYAETKVAFEEFLLQQPRTNNCLPTCLRFSTVYGLSQRPRFDLTVNEFTKELALGRELVVFGEQFWRPYCHVIDLARSVLTALKKSPDKVAFNVFNVGSTDENYTKLSIVEEITKQIPGSKIKYVNKEDDPRDYRVNFDKIQQELGFEITLKVPDGIKHIKQAIEDGFFKNPDDTKYKNIN